MSNLQTHDFGTNDEKSANRSPVSSRSSHLHTSSLGEKKLEDYGEETGANGENNKSASQISLPEDIPRDDGETGVPATRVTTKHSVSHVASIPNGGALAWMQVVGAFFLFFNTWYVLTLVFSSQCRVFLRLSDLGYMLFLATPNRSAGCFRSPLFLPGLWFAPKIGR
jgi:hypothetical protein